MSSYCRNLAAKSVSESIAPILGLQRPVSPSATSQGLWLFVHPDMGHVSESNLLPEILAVLPMDPYDQLDIASKITSMAVTSRVGELEAEVGSLRQKSAEKELVISTLQGRVSELQHALQQSNARLSSALDEQAKLATEKDALAASMKKLTRDVVKLETFKRTLMNSLQEEDGNQAQDDDDKKSTSRLSTIDSLVSSVVPQRDSKSSSTHQLVFSLTPPNLTPQLTPSVSPRKHSTTTSSKARSMAVSPTGQSVKGSHGRFSLPSSLSTSKHSTAPNSPPHTGSHSARTARVDGKQFFRQARNRLSYEQFSALLTNIKELNAHNQTREETLIKASEIFGPDNEDLYSAFDGLLNRHLPGQG